MTHCRWKHRSVTLLLVLLILVGLLCPAYAIKSTYETGWPMLGKYSENNVSGSYYNLTTAITCAEYPADGDISRENLTQIKLPVLAGNSLKTSKLSRFPA